MGFESYICAETQQDAEKHGYWGGGGEHGHQNNRFINSAVVLQHQISLTPVR
jgi:hypothetical protein